MKSDNNKLKFDFSKSNNFCENCPNKTDNSCEFCICFEKPNEHKEVLVD